MVKTLNAPTAIDEARWPEDYVLLDGGRLRVRKDYLPTFEALGWRTLEAVMSTDHCRVVRRVGQRDNCRLEMDRPDGIVRAYLKRHWNRSLWRRLLAPVVGDCLVSPGIAEAEAVGSCQRAGVPTMSVIAAGQALEPSTGQELSFFLSEEIRDGVPADDFWKQRCGRPEDGLASEVERLAVLDALAETARRFHQANLFHRDFYWCHFFVREPAPGRFQAHLIDVQRVKRSRWFRWRWLLKDLAQFQFSIPADYVSEPEQLYWFKRYRQVDELSWLDRLIHRLVRLRAWLYQRKEERR